MQRSNVNIISIFFRNTFKCKRDYSVCVLQIGITQSENRMSCSLAFIIETSSDASLLLLKTSTTRLLPQAKRFTALALTPHKA